MLHRGDPKNSGRITKFTLVWLGVCLLIFQTLSSSAQTPIYSYSGGINGTSQFTDNGNGDESLTFTGTQTGMGTLGLTVATPPPDPTLTISEAIDNVSAFAWTAYILTVSMNMNFSINSANVTAPPGWTATITPPTGPVSGLYTGTIDYVGGTPVAIYPASNSELDIGYQVQFASPTSYTLTESAMPIPEPGALSLLLVGGFLFSGRVIAGYRQRKLRAAG